MNSPAAAGQAKRKEIPDEELSLKANGFFHKLRDYFTEYCNSASIHGIRYFGEQHRSIIEKIWWFAALTVSLYFCVTLILKTYKKWETSPVIVSFATTETPIWQIPFPAVTICPETKSVSEKFNYTKAMYDKQDGKVLSDEDELKLSYLSAVCKYNPEIKFSNLTETKYMGDEIFDFFEQVSPKFYENVHGCSYMGTPIDCKLIWMPVITDEGLCYAFNLLGREEILAADVKHYKKYHVNPKPSSWSLEYGYEKNAAKEVFPRRALYAGALFALEIKLTTHDADLDFTCGSSIQGFKIQIHHPSMLPRVKQQHFRIPLDQSVIAALMPSIMTTSEAVKSYQPQKRQCFFPSERDLKYFKVYTQQNCQIECKTNYTLEKCGCVDFYMPSTLTALQRVFKIDCLCRFYQGNVKTEICGGPLKRCMLNAEHDLLSEGIDTKLAEINGKSGDEKSDGAHEILKSCNCLPECTAMTYVVENSQSDWDWVSQNKFDRGAKKVNKNTTHMSYLQVFFKGNQFITSERNELYGPTDFLANFGGLLGLFTGFSILSLIEMVYFLSLRIACNINLFGIKYWHGKQE